MRHLILQIILTLAFSLPMINAQAASISMLTIDGVDGPGDVGAYPLDAPFSWSQHRYPGSSTAHIWQLPPGTDGGIILGQAQPGQSQITASRLMYNLPSWLFSVGDGITMNADESLNFQNLRMFWGGTILDLGNTAGYSAYIPKLADISQLSTTSNGWVLENDGTYNLVFQSAGLCDGCELTIHLHGTAVAAVPVPSVVWLFVSYLAGVFGVSYRKGKTQI